MLKTILLLGSETLPELQLIRQKLNKSNSRTILLDTARLPLDFQISWSPEHNAGLLHCSCGTYELAEIAAAFWFRFTPPRGISEPTIQKDYQSLLNLLLHNPAISWRNHINTIRYHQQKPQQLAHAKQLGLSVPASYIGNNIDQAMLFANCHRTTIAKPVHGGDYAERLAEGPQLKQALSARLQRSPVTLQQFIAGTNIRTYVIDDTVLSVEIASANTDFRTDPKAYLLPHALSQSAHHQALTLCAAFGMHWTAIDWRLTPDGEYVFLEANPAPCFYRFEQQSRLPLSDLLTDMLLKAANQPLH